jgi:PAS domain S-box-containing protein
MEESLKKLRRFDPRLFLGLALLVFAFLLSAWATYRNLTLLYADARWVEHSHEVIHSLQSILSLAKDAETGERGYLLAGQEAYLEPYQIAISKLEPEIDMLKVLISDNPPQQARMRALEASLESERNLLASHIALRRGMAIAPAQQLALLDEARIQMDALRNLVTKMSDAETALLKNRTKSYAKTYRKALTTGVITSTIGLISIVAFVYLLNQSLRIRSAASDALYRERERFAVTLGSIGDGVLTTDLHGRVTFVNPIASELTGWSNDEAALLPIETVFDIIHEETRNKVENPAFRAFTYGTIVGLANHTSLISKDGTERAIADSAAPIRASDGSIFGAVLVFRDVSEERVAEKALQQSEALKAAILNTAIDAIITCDAAARIVEMNPAAERIFGYARVEVLGKDLGDLIVPESLRERHRQGLARYLATGEGVILNKHLELPALRADGTEFPVELTVTRISSPGPVLFTAYIRDITEKKSAAEALLRLTDEAERERRLYETIFASIPDLVYVFDLQHRFTYANDALLKMLGKTWEESIGKTCLELGYPNWHAQKHDREIDQVIQTKRPVRSEVPFTGANGTRIYDYIFVPVIANDGAVEAVAGTTRDITNRKHMEEHLRTVAAELSEANRRKNEFLATLAHELRNPLAPIRTGLEVIKQAQGDIELIADTRGMMERQVQQMVRLIDDLLDVARITQGKLELRKRRALLSEIVTSAVEATRPALEEAGHRLTVSIPPQPVHLIADPNRLAQVIANLLNNASKYTPDGGSIWLTAEQTDREIIVRVKDTGFGIPADMVERIFEMFAQIDRPVEKGYTGLGIGLTLVKRMVEMHGGSIEVSSAGTNRGSEFTVRLPWSSEMENVSGADDEANAVAEAPSMRSLKILVVDDNEAAAEMLQKVLSIMGHEVRMAFDGEAAVSAAETLRPDLVLMDLGMPRLNGYEAAQQIRAKSWGKEMVLVALTGWGQEEDKQRTQLAGFDLHLVKPIEPTVLQSVIEKFREPAE